MDTVQVISVSLPAATLYVSGTVNGTAVTWTNTEGNTWQATAARAADDIYLVELTIIGSTGSSTTASMTLYYGLLNLITDRTQGDVNRVITLAGKVSAGTATEAELAEWATNLKGAYNASDLNRVGAAVAYVAGRLNGYGYATPGYERIHFNRTVKQPGRLPTGYTELDYVKSTGTQYINTGFVPDANSKIHIKFQTSTAKCVIAGCDKGYRVSSFMIAATIASFNTGSGAISVADGKTHEIDFYSGAVKVDGVNKSNPGSGTFSTDLSVYLYCNNRSGATEEFMSGNIYECSLYNGDTKTRDFVPCRNSGGAVGFYDLVSGQFFANSGTGSFSAGPETVFPDIPDPDHDPYTWYDFDIPAAGPMGQYITNILSVRGAISVTDSTPPTPESAGGLTWQEANNIEQILLDVDALLTKMAQAWFYSGDLYAGEV